MTAMKPVLLVPMDDVDHEMAAMLSETLTAQLPGYQVVIVSGMRGNATVIAAAEYANNHLTQQLLREEDPPL